MTTRPCLDGLDPEFAAVTVALYPVGGKALAYTDRERREVDTERLERAARKWSSAERLLVEVALALWRGTGAVGLGALVTTLDGAHWQAFADALATRRHADLAGHAPQPVRP
jgi:hypothetical protein